MTGIINVKPIIPATMPIAIGKRVLMLFLKLLNRLDIEESSLSYIPNDTAIVPPLTPGITFATPTKMPLIKSIKKFIIKPFIIS